MILKQQKGSLDRRARKHHAEHDGYIASLIILSLLLSGCPNRDTQTPNPTKSTEKSSNATPPVVPPSNTQDKLTPSDFPVAFQDVTSQTGIQWTYRNGQEANQSSIVESLGGGVAALDFDNDGRYDLIFAGGGTFDPEKKTLPGYPSGLFQQRDQLKFREVSQSASTDKPGHYSHGIAAADFDQDGFTDLLVSGYGGVTLWRNAGDGTFTDSTLAAGLDDQNWSSSVAWGDFNGDQQLDLYIAHYVNWSFDNHPVCPGPKPGEREICSPRDFSGLNDLLYFSRGDGTFEIATDAGLVSGGKGLGVVASDFNLDGKLDLYVANDTEPNFLYLNQGNGKLLEVGQRSNVATDDEGIPNGSMGVDVCDYNRDGRPDLWAANYERESFALYRNEGDNFFLHVSRATGITALGGLFVGFGSVFTDVDGDLDEDVVVANGHVIKYPTHTNRRQSPLVLLQQGNRFIRAKFPDDSYFNTFREGRGLITIDLDNDAVGDFVFCHLNEAATVLKHTAPQFANRLSVRLIGTTSPRDPIGARIVLETSKGAIHRYVKGGASYLSTSDPRQLFAWPTDAKPEKLIVHWPSGLKTELSYERVAELLAENPSEPILTILEPANS